MRDNRRVCLWKRWMQIRAGGWDDSNEEVSMPGRICWSWQRLLRERLEENFHSKPKQEDFIFLAKSYDDTCVESEQCKPLLGDKASCNDNKCTCDDSLHFKDGKCNDKKGLYELMYWLSLLQTWFCWLSLLQNWFWKKNLAIFCIVQFTWKNVAFSIVSLQICMSRN